MNVRRLFLPTLACSGALALASCAVDAETPPEEGQQTDLTVVTSIDVYADLVETIAGDTVEVEPLVASTAIDPHSYEATPQDRLTVERSDIIIANGGGYDSFITLLASAADKDDDVYQLIGGENQHSHDGEGGWENEHIWYDLELMTEFVQDFAEHLGELAPDNAEIYEQNAAHLAAELEALDERNRALDSDGLSYLATEAVSGYLLDHAGLDNRTEPEFLNAIEHGDDVSPRLYSQALDLAEEVDLLSYNSQTETQQSSRIRTAAEDADTSVIEFTETIPEEASGYLDWMDSNIDQLEQALGELRGTE